MKLGIMQPYFFPYLGYFSLISHTDEWVVFDPVQYIRHGWLNRNRVLKPGGGWQYIIVPLAKHARNTPIDRIEVKNQLPWKERILAQLEHYRKRAPHYDGTVELLRDIFSADFTRLSDLNVHILKRVCAHLEIPFRHRLYRDLHLNLRVDHPGLWALEISRALGAKQYVNPPGGREIFDEELFRASGIELSFLRNELRPYRQLGNEFEPGLSIIDVLLFNSREETREMIEAYVLE